jgi:hypothetical protein
VRDGYVTGVGVGVGVGVAEDGGAAVGVGVAVACGLSGEPGESSRLAPGVDGRDGVGVALGFGGFAFFLGFGFAFALQCVFALLHFFGVAWLAVELPPSDASASRIASQLT